MWVIVTNSQYNKKQKVVMVDRRKDRNRFWSKYLDFAMVYDSKVSATEKAESLEYNDPEVIHIDSAEKILKRMSGVDLNKII